MLHCRNKTSMRTIILSWKKFRNMNSNCKNLKKEKEFKVLKLVGKKEN